MPGSWDTAIARLATRQRGFVHCDQLYGLGLPRGAIEHRIRRGLLIPVHHGVYAVGHLPSGDWPRSAAALLAGGPGTFLGTRSAGAVHGFLPWPVGPTELLTTRHVRSTPKILVRRTRWLPDHHVMRRGDLWVTTPQRTLLDLALVLDGPQLLKAASEAEFRRMVDLQKLIAAQLPGRGGPAWQHLVQNVRRRTRSELEALFLRFCSERAVPRPQVNVKIGNQRADFVWPDHDLIVETDGYETHRGRQAFERDRHRITVFMAAGWDVLPTTWRQVKNEPDLLARAIHSRVTT